jgi:hypothetical protein
MKLTIVLFSFIFILNACGPQRKVRYLQDDDESKDESLSQSMTVGYTVPDPGSDANSADFSATAVSSYIMMGEKKYYVSNTTSQTIKNYLITLPAGNHQINIKGRFSQEPAVVNGTQAIVNVVDILEIY